MLKRLIQWKPLNGITLGQREIDSNSRMMLIRELASTFIRYEKEIWVLSIRINLIPLND